MQWKDVGNALKGFAPILGTVVGGPGVGAMVAGALGCGNDPVEVMNAISNDRTGAVAKLQELEMNNKAELEKLIIQQEISQHAEINKTIRAELQNENLYKSGWRPFFGWAGGVTWVIQSLTIVGLLIYAATLEDTVLRASIHDSLVNVVDALTPMWGMLLMIIGVGKVARSNDKNNKLGIKPTGLMSKIF